MNLINILKLLDTTDYTLVIPSVSVGNIGQLAVDLLISNFNLTKFANVWDPAIIPSVGGDPFAADSTEVCTSCELFGNDSLKLAVLQLRSSIEYRLAENFFKKLCQNIIELKFKEVIILTSCFDYEKHTVDAGSFHYISNLNENSLAIFKQLDINPMSNILNGAGFALKLYEILSDEKLNCTILIKYCSEGDNRPDALQMLSFLCKILNLPDCESPTFPKSWEFVFGNPPPVGIY